ncbi:flagellar assembly protein FliW [Paenibacillus sp. GYB003]|uniref:flagellar assembly protein FliW n=1 Tax=Paenibacillus sp. GYB003 TaxID=2994392 RepID=UPI002F96141B
MIVQSAMYGELEIKEDEVVTLTQGIPGFEAFTRYAVIHLDDEGPFRVFQSLEDTDISFILVYPYYFFADYDIELTDAVQEELSIEKPDDAEVWCIVTVQEHIHDATINLMAPLIVNRHNRIGKQVILHESGYSVRQRLLPEQAALSETEG